MVRGRFITLEGGEGSGKSTQVARLTTALRAEGIDALATREPGGTEGAEFIRKLLVEGPTDRWQPLTEVLLHYAARREHVDKVIEPTLSAGRWVISDRFADSTMAYQGYAQGVGRTAVERIDRAVLGGFAPNLTILLDMPVARGLARARERGGADRYERMGEAFHAHLRDAFMDIARREPARCVVIDADADFETVAKRVRGAVRARLGV
jgi:dTMP kinase